MFQDGFQIAVDKITEKCREFFVERLCAIYITGSVSTNEAVIGQSDLDLFGYILDTVTDECREWIAKIELEMEKQFEVFSEVHINIDSVENLKKDKFARFALKYNSILYYGHDIVSEIDSSGVEVYVPKTFAKSRLPFARKCFSDALNNVCPQCIDKIPENTFMAARKYARYFIVVEGVYFLMCKNEFKTYKQEIVIAQLKENSIEFNDILDLCLTVLEDPIAAGIKHNDFLVTISPFVNWLFTKIDFA